MVALGLCQPDTFPDAAQQLHLTLDLVIAVERERYGAARAAFHGAWIALALRTKQLDNRKHAGADGVRGMG